MDWNCFWKAFYWRLLNLVQDMIAIVANWTDNWINESECKKKTIEHCPIAGLLPACFKLSYIYLVFTVFVIIRGQSVHFESITLIFCFWIFQWNLMLFIFNSQSPILTEPWANNSGHHHKWHTNHKLTFIKWIIIIY